MSCEQVGKIFMEQMCVLRPRAMMAKASDHANAQSLKMRYPLVSPFPAACVRMLGRDGLPQQGIAHFSNAERSSRIQIRKPVKMSRFCNLVAIRICDANDRTFKTTPEFRHLLCVSLHPPDLMLPMVCGNAKSPQRFDFENTVFRG